MRGHGCPCQHLHYTAKTDSSQEGDFFGTLFQFLSGIPPQSVPNPFGEFLSVQLGRALKRGLLRFADAKLDEFRFGIRHRFGGCPALLGHATNVMTKKSFVKRFPGLTMYFIVTTINFTKRE